jgi:hypothetical protein
MSALTAIIIAAGVAVGAGAIWCFVRIARLWQQYRGVRVVTCPETGRPAVVLIDAAHMAITAARKAPGELRLAACSRWTTRGRCDEACLAEASDPGSTVTAMASRWYAGKRCAYCRKPVGDQRLVAHDAAVLRPDGTTLDWSDVAPERLPDALRTGWPVCWDCHIAETFRRQYPLLVTDRTNTRRAS